jgi:glycosyltransferase involved in cell wall biosynthesis
MSVSQPLVSIVLIFLNEERFLQESIASVFA